jgi:hypothetical protein
MGVCQAGNHEQPARNGPVPVPYYSTKGAGRKVARWEQALRSGYPGCPNGVSSVGRIGAQATPTAADQEPRRLSSFPAYAPDARSRGSVGMLQSRRFEGAKRLPVLSPATGKNSAFGSGRLLPLACARDTAELDKACPMSASSRWPDIEDHPLDAGSSCASQVPSGDVRAQGTARDDGEERTVQCAGTRDGVPSACLALFSADEHGAAVGPEAARPRGRDGPVHGSRVRRRPGSRPWVQRWNRQSETAQQPRPPAKPVLLSGATQATCRVAATH